MELLPFRSDEYSRCFAGSVQATVCCLVKPIGKEYRRCEICRRNKL
jgi:hypothetical protein